MGLKMMYPPPMKKIFSQTDVKAGMVFFGGWGLFFVILAALLSEWWAVVCFVAFGVVPPLLMSLFARKD